MAEQRCVGDGPKSFKAVDRGEPANVLPGLVAARFVLGEVGAQASVDGGRIGAHGGFDRDALQECGLVFVHGGVGDRVQVDSRRPARRC